VKTIKFRIMPIGLVAGHAGTVTRVRATQLYNAIPIADRVNWRIFYFDAARTVQEYTTSSFNNNTVVVAAETHCFIFCHGLYTSASGNRSAGLSWWDIDENHGTFNTTFYTNWLQNIGLGITTVTIAACHAGDVGVVPPTVAPAPGPTPIQRIIAVRPGIQADGPNDALLALGGVNVNWNAANPSAGWTRF
jgi:hypothetical protein